MKVKGMELLLSMVREGDWGVRRISYNSIERLSKEGDMLTKVRMLDLLERMESEGGEGHIESFILRGKELMCQTCRRKGSGSLATSGDRQLPPYWQKNEFSRAGEW